MSDWVWDDEEVDIRPAPFTLAGYRQVETGELVSAECASSLDLRWWIPLYTGGPELTAPLLEALIHLVDDRAETSDRQMESFTRHRLAAQQALSEFVAAGGQIP